MALGIGPSARMRVLALVSLLAAAYAVDHSKFRTCASTSFCRRHRGHKPPRGYVIAPGSVSLAAGTVTASLHGGPFGVALALTVRAYASGVIRLRITEAAPLHGPRWEPDDILISPATASLRELSADARELPEGVRAAVGSGEAMAWALAPAEGGGETPPAANSVLVINLHPFAVTLYTDGECIHTSEHIHIYMISSHCSPPPAPDPPPFFTPEMDSYIQATPPLNHPYRHSLAAVTPPPPVTCPPPPPPPLCEPLDSSCRGAGDGVQQRRQAPV